MQYAPQQKQCQLVLASKSPRRRDLLNCLGLEFQVIGSDVEELVDLNLSPREIVVDLAKQKVSAVKDKLLSLKEKIAGSKYIEEILPEAILIGADTIVVCEGRVLGKPNSKEDAISMLTFLSGKTHSVFTGIAVMTYRYDDSEPVLMTDLEESKVKIRNLQQREIEAYVNTDEPLDKAGSYALQGLGAIFVENIEGCYTNIIGLPIPKLVLMLRRAGIKILS